MKRRLFGAVALGCLFVSFAIPVAEGDPSRSAPMQFALRQEGSGACAPKCRLWVSATGMIRAETARDFEAFAAKTNIRGATIALNSEGGSVHGAIALGRAIRKFGMTTTVGRTIDGASGAEAAQRMASLSPRADCESMCAFVLLAGQRRVVPNEARVRVHQIWLGDRRDDAAAATYSAEDLVLVQRDIGKLAQYTIEMGGTVELLEVSLRIPPWEPMRALTRDELRRMNLDNSDVADARPANPEAATTAAPSSFPVKRIAMTGQRERDKDRGWVVAERAGNSTLTRRHPLTVDGEELGSFEVAFACGSTANDFLLLYTETRRGSDAPQSLKSVEIRLAGKSILLSPGPSRGGPSAAAGLSSASGVVTASVLKSFAASASRSLTVETTLDNAAGLIRLGNTNAFHNLPSFLASCAEPGRAEHARLQAVE